MRLYLKLLIAIALFLFASQIPSRDMIADLAYDVHVAAVCRFGDAADFEQLLDETQRALAAQRGELDLYLRGKRFDQLFAERIALAECEAGAGLPESHRDRIREECEREAFGQRELDNSPLR